MNILQAKEQIRDAVAAYLTRDETGNYIVPTERQRPVFLLGPPGIGKTAIMAQIAGEMNINLLSYSMTHHTRQSALGLPFILKKTFDGEEYEVSEYTMSEIIAAVYEKMEETGIREGILFLDEINCVSETLTPSILQFLQYKTFGRHRLPDGWVITAAGNPPEYNRAVREFDVAILDRLKQMDIEPDVEAWKRYALEKGIHPAVISYLNLKKEDFYRIETGVSGVRFVTARGWEDLSQMLTLYEKNHFAVDENLVAQYLRNEKVAREFELHYRLFVRYRERYQADRILEGEMPEEILTQAGQAAFDERLSLTELLTDAVTSEMKTVLEKERMLHELEEEVKKAALSHTGSEAVYLRETAARMTKQSRSAGREEMLRTAKLTALLETCAGQFDVPSEGLEAVRETVRGKRRELKTESDRVSSRLANVFAFCGGAFGTESQEMLVLVTELTVNRNSAGFIGRYGSEEYDVNSRRLMLADRRESLLAEAAKL
ncbi:MAG: AAA family ATPase [Oscillospiraceae bacterium]|nr:AAA family ATPase [Oscillospiraceae bacterium]